MNPEEDAWQLAISSKPYEAYGKLIELDGSHAKSPELALRLYWLLALNPELDAKRSRHDWLAAALIRSQLSAPALELYKRELEANPEVGLSGPYQQVLGASAPPSSLLWLAKPRLAAAGLKRLWSSIENDLDKLSFQL